MGKDKITPKTCENCKWWSEITMYLRDGQKCLNKKVNRCLTGRIFLPDKDFGCNQWEGKDND